MTTTEPGRLSGRTVALILAVGLALQCAPLLVTRVLPFHDAPGIVGLGGVFAHLDDPRTRVGDFFDVDYGPYPSIGYFGWAWLAAKAHVPVDVAFNVFIALFCLAGPPLALLVVLRAFGRPPSLALLALPIGYHHQIWYGFLGSGAAITGLLLALGCARRMVQGPPRAGPHVGLAAALLFVAVCHPFTLALALALAAPVLVAPVAAATVPGRLGGRALRLACFAPTAIFLAAWVRTFFGAGPGDGVGLAGHLAATLRTPHPPPIENLRTFAVWLGGGYRSHVQDFVVGAALLALGAFLALGVRSERDAGTSPRWNTWWLAWAAAVLAGGYLILPDKVYWPTYWWGVRVRCVAPLFLVAVAAVRPSRRGLPGWAALPSAAVAALFAGYVTNDFRHHWKDRALEGFDQALAAIPPGQSVLAMPALPDPHYTLGHPYLVQYYVARTGGRAVPYLGGHPGSYWVTMKPAPVSPPWGDPAQLDWPVHGLGYDYFLFEQGQVPDPLVSLPAGAVRLLVARGPWRLYRRERLPLPGDPGLPRSPDDR